MGSRVYSRSLLLVGIWKSDTPVFHFPLKYFIMCMSKRWVKNPYTRKMILVNCGKCPACLQQKADLRTYKINNSVGTDNYAVFTHLTYANDHIPHIIKQDILIKTKYDRFSEFSIPIFRERNVSRVRIDDSYNTYRRDFVEGQIGEYQISDVSLPELKRMALQAPPLVNGRGSQVGILFYPDFQHFIKRLRINIKRAGYDFCFKYVCAGEYGSVHHRPHFHVILILPLSAPYFVVKAAISEAWPFDDYDLTYRNTEIARNAAAYCSSYVNCASSVPELLGMSKKTRPCFHMSSKMGTALDSFLFPALVQAFYSGDLRYNQQSYRDKTLVTERMLLPKYVISRYFPKFRGYSRLTSHKIQLAIERSEKIESRWFAELTNINPIDAKVYRIFIDNKVRFAESQGMSRQEYAYIASRIWPLYYSCLYKEQFKSVRSYADYFELYDNIEYFYTGDTLSPTLDSLVDHVIYPETDPNLFRLNVQKTERAAFRYDKKDKSKRRRHTLFALADPLNKYHF